MTSDEYEASVINPFTP